MKRSASGFTIVELLIVIVVIAILATISVVAYNGIQARAENSKTIAGVSEYLKILTMYKAANGDYPATPANPPRVCLGSGYSDNTCATDTDGTTVLGADNLTFNQTLRTIANPLPQVSTRSFSASNGQEVAGANFQYSSGGSPILKYYLSGTTEQCVSGAVRNVIDGNLVYCVLLLD